MKIGNDMAGYFAATRGAPAAGRSASAPETRSSYKIDPNACLLTLSGAAVAAAANAASGASGASAAAGDAKGAAEHPSRIYQERELRDAQADPAYAKKAAHDFAYNDSYMLHGPMVNINYEPFRYSATGEVVTDDGIAAFKSQAKEARDQLIALYQSEKGKGTPDAEILEKLFRARDTQPKEYLQKLNWATA